MTAFFFEGGMFFCMVCMALLTPSFVTTVWTVNRDCIKGRY
jgi:hypothetical protein